MSTSGSMESLFMSPAFTFLVGPDKTAMTVHKALARGLSDPLYALMNNGQMSESISGVATLEDTEVSVFSAFCEFAYRGYYLPPPVKEDHSTKPEEDGGVKRKLCELDAAPTPKSYSPKPLSDRSKKIWRRFLRRTFEAGPCRAQGHSKDREAMFLNLKIYVFATQYLIKPLRDQCLSRIYESLKELEFPAEENTMADICIFVERVYTQTERKEAFGPQLRHIVSLYVASRAEILFQHKRMISLMDTYGELGSDVARLLVG